jgi:hypothetical protein
MKKTLFAIAIVMTVASNGYAKFSSDIAGSRVACSRGFKEIVITKNRDTIAIFDDAVEMFFKVNTSVKPTTDGVSTISYAGTNKGKGPKKIVLTFADTGDSMNLDGHSFSIECP